MLMSTASAIHEADVTDEMTESRQALKQSQNFSLQRAWTAGIILLLAAALYLRIAIKLVRDWYSISDDSHGLLIPFFIAFLIWDKRETLRSTPLRPTWAGLTLVLAGIFILFIGVFGADLFLSRLSFLFLAAGVVWTLLGKPMLGETRFMLFVALLAIPLPTLVLNHVTFPLQLLSSRVASDLLPIAGVPTLREGNVIRLPVMELEVAEACSGIRSLMSLFTVAVIYGYFIEKSTARRIILALASIPIAVAANAFRIFGTGLCVQYWDPDKAMGFFHEFSGWLMFIVSLCLLYLVHLSMSAFAAKRKVAA